MDRKKLATEMEYRTDDEEDEIEVLSPEHQHYLLQRHGTLDLDPMPSMDPADPYNWSNSKKIINHTLVAFHAIVATGALHRRPRRCPLFWRPLANRYGRRPIFLISLLCSVAGNIGCAKSHTYATMGLCRAITGFFISPAAAIGSAVVSETFFKRERATYMGIWTIMVTCGVPIAPFIFGFVAQRVDYRWIYWILAMVPPIASYFHFRRIDPRPLTLTSLFQPFIYSLKPRICLPAISYAMVFMWAFILPTILIPEIFPLIGEQLGGRTSDWWMRRRHRVLNAPPPPEYRLWLSYPGFALSIIGTVVFLVQIQHLGTSWNITPLIGVVIASVGNQLVTTVLITYAVDCYREDAAGVGVFIVFVRQTWGFIGPFWWNALIDKVQYTGMAGVAVAFMVVFSVLPIVWLQVAA
ncbi:major facilitator superfamily domain-containing protein [Roridomyces roridus]|uniref:Major facilitator superfamily domain-containing protein n=1 Tax=Roridomyces roridus TaxID=1738132 RepID=A0AAD7FC88_9AGAR|nr:major facilitator superfamily domain-containing protein [Roridomyces roridus]